jgi:molecular chaperone GrpE
MNGRLTDGPNYGRLVKSSTPRPRGNREGGDHRGYGWTRMTWSDLKRLFRRGEDKREPTERLLTKNREELAEALSVQEETLSRILKNILKQGQAQEMFQARVSAQLTGLGDRLIRMDRRLSEGEGAGETPPGEEARLTSPQMDSLARLGDAFAYLRQCLSLEPSTPGTSADPSFVEAAGMLADKFREVLESFQLKPIPTVGYLFDDRLHKVHDTVTRPEFADAAIVEEVRPGYLLKDRTLRPALVIVNKLS